MSKILVLSGPPASGKSSFAREFIKENRHWVIVCRDSIRQSLGEYWVPEREDLVSKLEYESIVRSIEMGWNVIIDATNLNKKTIAKWEALADEMECEIEYKQFLIPFQEAVNRDNNPDRDHKVGYKVLYDFYKKYFPEQIDDKNWDNRYILEPDPNKRNCIVCDLDGTICLRRGRSPYEYDKCYTDAPNKNVITLLLNLHKSGYDIIFVSGRENIGDCQKNTMQWLAENYGENFQLYMREERDHRPDKIIKEEIYHRFIEPKYNVVAVFDDRDQVIKVWRDLGLLALQVYYGDF